MRKVIITIILAAAIAAGANAQKFKFAYDLNFEYNFDNREFDTGENLYTNSMTINAARLTPLIGIKVNETGQLRHKLLSGIDIMKEMGKAPVGNGDEALENAKLFQELLIFYNLNANVGKTQINGYAGQFPRRLFRGEYGNEFLSDSLRFYDNNVEGVLLQFRRPKSLYELSCDWLGQFGSMRREKFILAGYGCSEFMPWLSAGMTISYTHLANMLEYGGVVDNLLSQPFVKFNFRPFLPLEELSLKLSWLQGMQRDRVKDKEFDFPHGAQLDLKVMKWKVGIENKAYFGTGLMPYYNVKDAGGNTYGELLYHGDPFYRVIPIVTDLGETGFYDRLEVFYQPKISDYLYIRLSLFCHFAENASGDIDFAGSRQKFSLIFNL